ncbi:MAG: hypothetical protein Q7R66_08265 [Undibacterium sp.]|uniref:hypothetical protein n=1 Tax=Undibacterium sp. TaxID=1914977 RepID=UPI00271AA01D|nr:hypothetical protein [Undibacterium sp.]MDO8652167.1 hypothetical protein [Undibacterium sp.]
MTYLYLSKKTLESVILAMMIALMTACASGPEYVSHGFSYDAIRDSPDIEILDYAYGNEYAMTRAPDWQKENGTVKQGGGITGAMPRGGSLFVKWRVKATGVEYQDTVDLRHRLPANIRDHKIHFIVRNTQLFIYLITPERRKENEAKNGPASYGHRKVITIYPGQPQF